MYRKKIGIKYIANLAGMSTATVSRALRGDTATSSKTAKRIKKIAKELDYFPDLYAKGLRENRTNTIGVIFNDMNNPFYSEILNPISEQLINKDYSIIVGYSNWDLEQERKNIRTMLSKRVDGIIMSPVDDKSENINILIRNNVRTVMIDCYPYFPQVNYVSTDHKKASILAATHLIENGHKDILMITMPFENLDAKYYLEGYKNTLSKNNIKLNEEYIIKTPDISIQSGYEIFKKVINNKRLKFTAIITISDLIAAGVYKAAREQGLKIPVDFSIIGYDNIQLSTVLSPPLTTVSQPRNKIGLQSINLLINSIENKSNADIVKKIFTPKIILRNSVRNIKK